VFTLVRAGLTGTCEGAKLSAERRSTGITGSGWLGSISLYHLPRSAGRGVVLLCHPCNRRTRRDERDQKYHPMEGFAAHTLLETELTLKAALQSHVYTNLSSVSIAVEKKPAERATERTCPVGLDASPGNSPLSCGPPEVNELNGTGDAPRGL
jgi:hypothetical protein